jgi:hypothetical protein
MAERLAIADVQAEQADVEIDLWGTEYRKVPATRAVGQKARDIWEKIRGAEDDDTVMEQIAAMLDLRLKPSNGDSTKASTRVKAKWKANEIDVYAVLTFMERLAETDRPT